MLIFYGGRNQRRSLRKRAGIAFPVDLTDMYNDSGCVVLDGTKLGGPVRDVGGRGFPHRQDMSAGSAGKGGA